MGPSAADLRTIPLFHGFGDDELAALSRLFARVPPDARSPLFDVGEPASVLYLLTAGEVVLDRPDDDIFRLHPPALIGELGALTGLPRSTRATLSPGAAVWALPAKTIQAHLQDHQELGVRFLVNLLGVVADKVHRDERRTADMRQHVIRTQKELKRLRDLVLETEETPLSAPLHDTLHRLITHNRRVNYRVEPLLALSATLRIEAGTAPILDLSRTHLSARVPRDVVATLATDTWLAGVLALPGIEIPISGRVFRIDGDRVTIHLDLLIDEYAAILEGYLTRVQLLDILV
jgi:CRP-like cAMP-binding protein